MRNIEIKINKDELKKKLDIKDGVDGKNGVDGKDGTQGPQGIQGPEGKPGKDGKDGSPGKDGKTTIGWGAHTINVQQSGTTKVKNVRNINFSGATVTATGDNATISGLVPTTRLINTTSPLTGGGDLSADRTIAIPASTDSVDGYLTSADHTTFNAKVGGSGTTNTIPKFGASSSLGNSQITDTGSVVAIAQTATPTYRFELGTGVAATDAFRTWAGVDFYLVPDPTTLPTLALASGTDLGIGQYFYTVTFYTALGETHGTNATTYQTITTTAGNQNVNLTNIPTSTDPRVIGRKIYRTVVGGFNYTAGLLTTIADNTTTTFLDNVPDGSLGLASGVHFRANTTSNLITVGGTKSMRVDKNLTLFGLNAGSSITSGGTSVLIGYNAGTGITSGTVNVFIGDSAGAIATTAYQNTLIGVSAGAKLTTGFTNTAIGYGAGGGSTGSGNTSVGQTAGSGLTTGSRNTSIGAGAGNANLTGSDNVFVGQQSGRITTGGGNTFLGSYSGYGNTSGVRNIYVGQYVGFYSTTGSDNVFIGSGQNANISGQKNVYVGSLAGRTSTGSSNVFLGYSAGENELGSNLLYIANTNTATPLIYGNFTTGSISIGLGAPTARLHLPAGTATASTAPLKMTSGSLMTTAEAGAVEYLTDDFYGTITTGAARKKFVLDDGTNLTSGTTPVATTNGRLTDGLILASGTYTPTITNVTNISASTAYQCQYMRVGNTVTVSGKVGLDITAVGAYEAGISLPIASNFGADEDCAGTGEGITSAPGAADSVYVKADITNDRASLNGNDNDTSNHSHFFMFTYQII